MKKYYAILLLFPFLSCAQDQKNKGIDESLLEKVELIDYQVGDSMIHVRFEHGYENYFHKRDFKIDTASRTIEIGSYIEEFGVTYEDEVGNIVAEPPASYYEMQKYAYNLLRPIEGTYIHKNGKVKVTKSLNESYDFTFTNHEGFVFKAEYKKIEKRPFYMLPLSSKSVFFRSDSVSGISIMEINGGRLYTHELGGFAALDYYTKIEDLYDFSFYKNEETEYTETLNVGKDKWCYFGEIHIPCSAVPDSLTKNGSTSYFDRYFKVKGQVEVELYKSEGKDYKRYVMKTPKFLPANLSTYTGHSLNQNGKALFIWEFADSEMYYLEGIDEWGEYQNNKKITVVGELNQGKKGAVIKNWIITKIEEKE